MVMAFWFSLVIILNFVLIGTWYGFQPAHGAVLVLAVTVIRVLYYTGAGCSIGSDDDSD